MKRTPRSSRSSFWNSVSFAIAFNSVTNSSRLGGHAATNVPDRELTRRQHHTRRLPRELPIKQWRRSGARQFAEAKPLRPISGFSISRCYWCRAPPDAAWHDPGVFAAADGLGRGEDGRQVVLRLVAEEAAGFL